jgi:hypothetical protein
LVQGWEHAGQAKEPSSKNPSEQWQLGAALALALTTHVKHTGVEVQFTHGWEQAGQISSSNPVS